jgi:acyl carrier protein
MESLIRQSLSNVGMDELPSDSTEDLTSYGLDSLMSALLFSELEITLKKDLITTNFTQESFRSIKNIEIFIKGNTK